MDILKLDPSHKLILIDIPQSEGSHPIYEAVRCAWKMSRARAEAADYVLAMAGGVCRGVYVATQWLPATKANFPRLGMDIDDRIGFVGTEAPREIWNRYVAKRLPEELARKRGHQQPFRYFWQGREGVTHW